VCPTAPEGLKFVDISPESIAKTTQDLGIDAWFLALHDNGAKPYVEALSRGVNPPILIDLSADHRFDPTWVYGQPEGGNREKNQGCQKDCQSWMLRYWDVCHTRAFGEGEFA